MTTKPAGSEATQESIEKEWLIGQLLQQVGLLQKRFLNEGEDEERRWMIEETRDERVAAFLREATVVTFDVIDAVGALEPVNGTTIARQYGILQGSVSKITRKLAEQGILRTETLPGNRKEVFFRLTPLGRQVYDVHRSLHAHIGRNVTSFMNRYNAAELKFLLQCMKDTLAMSWVAPGPDASAGDGQESAAPKTQTGTPGRTSEEEAEIAEISALLGRLDARQLGKAKALLQIAFDD